MTSRSTSDSYIKSLLMISGFLFLTACANHPTQYTVDPEVVISGAEQTAGKTVNISVTPPETILTSSDTENVKHLNADNDFSKAVKSSVIDALSQSGYKISSNKHFSDFAMTLDFHQLQVTLHKGTVKDEIKVNGKLTVELFQKPNTFKKSFSRSQSLVVALNANASEVTGLTNETVGKLLQAAFTDEQVLNFINTLQ